MKPPCDFKNPENTVATFSKLQNILRKLLYCIVTTTITRTMVLGAQTTVYT